MPETPRTRPSDADLPAQHPLEPGVRRFVRETASRYSEFPPLEAVTYPEARRIAEVVRERWRAGGPAMQYTAEDGVPVPHGKIRARVYDPGPQGSKPALIYLHGGGWTLFSIDTHDRVMREYAARAGICVVGVDYSLSPEHRFPKALDDVLATVTWLRDGGAGPAVDSSRLAIGGDSAGGNLAMAAGLALRDSGRAEGIKALLLNYAAFDVESSDRAIKSLGGEGNMLRHDEMLLFWRNYLRGPDDALNPLACPMKARLSGLPPVFLTIPECDLLAEQSLAMADRLRDAGVAVRAVVYSGASHSFLEAVSVSAVADRALAEGAAWLRQQLALEVGGRPGVDPSH
jgi:acetyl esterase